MYRERIIQIWKSPAAADILKWSKPCHLSVFVICICKMIWSASSLAVTVSTRGLVDGAAAKMPGQVAANALLLASAVLIIRLTAFLSGITYTKASAVFLKEMRSRLMEGLLRKQYAGLGSYHSGELVNRMFSDVSVVKSGVMDIVPDMVSMAVSFLGASVIMISMDWRFAVLLIFGGFLGLFLALVFKKPMMSRHRAVQESEGKLHAALQEILGNLSLIKASGSEERMVKKVQEKQEDLLSRQLKKGYFSTKINNGISMVFQLSWMFCMLWGCLGIYRGELTYGMLAAIISLVGQIQGPISNAAGIAGQAYATVSSAERLKELMDLPDEEEEDRWDGSVLYQKLDEIRFQNLDFSYGRETQKILENVSCVVRPGDFVAVTGISGEGKSTLFRLMLGIYRPTGGSVGFVFREGKECRYLDASRKTRALFAYVPQGNTLFSGTLRENFLMFTDFATDAEILEAAGIACIEGLIKELESGLDTVIGERGIGLSEGQAQRVAVARALLSKAPILLLDESTSALDEETEVKLLQNMEGLQNKTCLIVTHRKAALRICDYRLHIQDGKVSVQET